MPINLNGSPITQLKLNANINPTVTLNGVNNVVFKEVTVTFSLNYSGAGNYATQTRLYSHTNITNPGNPTRTSYTFDGWYTASSGGTKLTFPYTTPVNNTTYYARWSAESKTTAPSVIATGSFGTNTTTVEITNKDTLNAYIVSNLDVTPPTTERGFTPYNGLVSYSQSGAYSRAYSRATASGKSPSDIVSTRILMF